MQLVAKIKLEANAEERQQLLQMLSAANEAANWLAHKMFSIKCADAHKIQRLFYQEFKALFSLSAQYKLLIIRKVCGAYKRNLNKLSTFKPFSAIPVDTRLYRLNFKNNTISLRVLDRRITLPFVCSSVTRQRLLASYKQANLICRNGQFYLHIASDIPSVPPAPSVGTLGIDLGIVNIATDSDGAVHSGATVLKVRKRHRALRSRLQSKGTKSAKRHLKRLSGKESRFSKNTNHTISKCIVAKAEGTQRRIALEDLKGIRKGKTVGLAQRTNLHSWSFFQLRTFITYKAALKGISVVLVNSRNTSRTCPQCGCISKANRRTQADFCCIECGFSAHADWVGATNVARRADLNRPIVSVPQVIALVSLGTSSGL
jgi:IS605 OrfB family transposase